MTPFIVFFITTLIFLAIYLLSTIARNWYKGDPFNEERDEILKKVINLTSVGIAVFGLITFGFFLYALGKSEKNEITF